jgi:hypothetical protein
MSKIKRDRLIAVRLSSAEFKALSKIMDIEHQTISEVIRIMIKEMAKRYEVWDVQGKWEQQTE